MQKRIDRKAVRFDWNRARAFLVAAEEGSFSAAAKALQTTQSTIGRQIAALEEELGVSLFEKVGRGIEITPSGVELIEHVRTMDQAATRFSLKASGRSSSIEGTVAISATEAVAVYLLPDIIRELREEEPGINIEIVATNTASDLRRREADIAIRNFRPQHSDLIARRLEDMRAHLYATSSYLTRKGPFCSLDDFAKGDFIGFVDNAAYLKGLQQIGLPITGANFPYATESHIVHWSLTKAGAGIGAMVETVGDAEHSVTRVNKDIPPFLIETWIVAHRELRTNRRIRYVFDYLVKALSKLLC